MRTLLVIALSFFATNSFTQAPPIEWQHCYGGTLNDIGYSISCTSDGGYIFSGCAGSLDGDVFPLLGDPLHGSNCDYWYAKIDIAGTKQFKWNPGGTASDVARDAYETPDGGYMIAGGAASTDVDVWGNHGDFDFWVLKLNADGDTSWLKCYGGLGFEDFGKMAMTSDGGFIYCGGTASNDGQVSGNHGSNDFWLVKTNDAGVYQWAKCYGGNGYEKANDVKQCTDGGYLMVGFTDSQDGTGQVTGNHSLDLDGWVVKTDASGNLLWQKCFGGSGQDALTRVIPTSDGSFMAAGYTFSNDYDIALNQGDEDAWLLKFDAAGTLLWSKTFGGDTSEEFSCLEQDAAGHVIVGGYSRSDNGDLLLNYGEWDYWISGFDLDGNMIWDTTYGGKFNDVCNDLALTPDGGVILNGYTESNNGDVSGNHSALKDYWVVKLGNVVGIPEIKTTALTISPNLTKDLIQLSGIDAARNDLEISIWSADGIRVHSQMLSNKFNLTINVSSLPNGMYFIEASGKQTRAFGKFVKY